MAEGTAPSQLTNEQLLHEVVLRLRAYFTRDRILKILAIAALYTLVSVLTFNLLEDMFRGFGLSKVVTDVILSTAASVFSSIFYAAYIAWNANHHGNKLTRHDFIIPGMIMGYSIGFAAIILTAHGLKIGVTALAVAAGVSGGWVVPFAFAILTAVALVATGIYQTVKAVRADSAPISLSECFRSACTPAPSSSSTRYDDNFGHSPSARLHLLDNSDGNDDDDRFSDDSPHERGHTRSLEMERLDGESSSPSPGGTMR